MTEGRTAGEVLQARLAELVADLHRSDAEVRDGVENGVHQLRVACRRLRGALSTFRPLVDREVTDPVRADLRWLARTLGGSRDAEVAHARLRALVVDLPAATVVGPVRRRLDRFYGARQEIADEHTGQVLESPRYRRLLARLDAWAADPPFTAGAAAPADDLLAARVGRDAKRLARRIADAETAAQPGRDAAWHRARRAAKRFRYGAETLGDEGLTAVARRLTSLLGDRQDSVVVRADLRRIARDATAAGESAFTYGVLHEIERATAEGLLDDVEKARAKVRKKARKL